MNKLKRSPNEVLCLNCASIFTISTWRKKCPECHQKINMKMYNRIKYIAWGAIYHGYMYPKTYDEDKKKYGYTKYAYMLHSPSELLQFIGIAAISGVIGGVAYDVVKKIASKIKREYDEKGLNEKEDLAYKYSSDQLGDIMKYIERYLCSKSNMNEEEIKIIQQLFKEIENKFTN